MPVVLRIRGFKFYFYANEGDEPPHIHVDKGGATAKLGLSIRLAFVTVILIIVWIILHRLANQTLAPLKAIQQQQQSH